MTYKGTHTSLFTKRGIFVFHPNKESGNKHCQSTHRNISENINESIARLSCAHNRINHQLSSRLTTGWRLSHLKKIESHKQW